MAYSELIEHNIRFSKKYMVESIFRSANIEGIGVTFPETQVICDGMSVSGHSVDDINAIIDLKKTWQWIYQNPLNKIDIDTIKTINRILGKYTVVNSGHIRDRFDEPIRVGIGEGKYYYPHYIEDIEEIEKDIENIISSDDVIDNTIELFCYLCKKQLFNDGNKRTATLTSNLYMIQNGIGILSIPNEHKLMFFDLLTNYYKDDNNKSLLKEFLKVECLTFTNYGKKYAEELEEDEEVKKGMRL